MDKSVPELETERLILRGITGEDADCIVRWRSDKSVYQYFQSPHRLSKEEHIAWYEKEYAVDAKRIQWLGVRKDTGEKIGVFGVKRDESCRQEAEISYLLDRQSRGCGFGSEAVRKIMKWCEENGITTLRAMINERNRDSIRFIERMGFWQNEKVGCFVIYGKQISNVRGGSDR